MINSEINFSRSNLHKVVHSFLYEEAEHFVDIFVSNEEAFIGFMMTSLNMLGEPHEAMIYRTNPADGPVTYIGTFPLHTIVSQFPLEAFQQTFFEITKLNQKAKSPQ
jgi:hypothetical protein